MARQIPESEKNSPPSRHPLLSKSLKPQQLAHHLPQALVLTVFNLAVIDLLFHLHTLSKTYSDSPSSEDWIPTAAHIGPRLGYRVAWGARLFHHRPHPHKPPAAQTPAA